MDWYFHLFYDPAIKTINSEKEANCRSDYSNSFEHEKDKDNGISDEYIEVEMSDGVGNAVLESGCDYVLCVQ